MDGDSVDMVYQVSRCRAVGSRYLPLCCICSNMDGCGLSMINTAIMTFDVWFVCALAYLAQQFLLPVTSPRRTYRCLPTPAPPPACRACACYCFCSRYHLPCAHSARFVYSVLYVPRRAADVYAHDVFSRLTSAFIVFIEHSRSSRCIRRFTADCMRYCWPHATAATMPVTGCNAYCLPTSPWRFRADNLVNMPPRVFFTAFRGLYLYAATAAVLAVTTFFSVLFLLAFTTVPQRQHCRCCAPALYLSRH